MKPVLWTISALAVLALAFLFVRHVEAQTPSVTMLWTVPSGTQAGATYQMRYSRTPVGLDTLAWWNAANVVGAMPVPGPIGSTDSVRVPVVSFGTAYSFIIQTCNGATACSPWSNVAVVTTAPAPSPLQILNLRGH